MEEGSTLGRASKASLLPEWSLRATEEFEKREELRLEKWFFVLFYFSFMNSRHRMGGEK